MKRTRLHRGLKVRDRLMDRRYVTHTPWSEKPEHWAAKGRIAIAVPRPSGGLIVMPGWPDASRARTGRLYRLRMRLRKKFKTDTKGWE